MMTYNDFGGRILNLLFQNLDSSPQSQQDENLQTDRLSCYKSYTFFPKHLLLATLRDNGPDGCWIQFLLEIIMFLTLKLYSIFFSDTTNTTCYLIASQFPHKSTQIPVERMPIKLSYN